MGGRRGGEAKKLPVEAFGPFDELAGLGPHPIARIA
jgi:hypothetical protein